MEYKYCFTLFDGHKLYGDDDEQYSNLKSLNYDELSEIWFDNDSENTESFFDVWYNCINNLKNLSENAETFISKNYYVCPDPRLAKPWGWAKDNYENLYLICPRGSLLGLGNTKTTFRFWVLKKKPDSYQKFYDDEYVGFGIKKMREEKGWEI